VLKRLHWFSFLNIDRKIIPIWWSFFHIQKIQKKYGTDVLSSIWWCIRVVDAIKCDSVKSARLPVSSASRYLTLKHCCLWMYATDVRRQTASSLNAPWAGHNNVKYSMMVTTRRSSIFTTVNVITNNSHFKIRTKILRQMLNWIGVMLMLVTTRILYASY